MTHVDEAPVGPQNGLYQDGMSVRRAVLGDAYVDASLARADRFTSPLQDLITQYCWGAIWTRPGLGRRTRSLVNVGMLTALGRSDELALHVRGAIHNGCTEQEIQEVLLQAAVYCGVPAALEATRTAHRVVREMADADVPDTTAP